MDEEAIKLLRVMANALRVIAMCEGIKHAKQDDQGDIEKAIQLEVTLLVDSLFED